MMTRFLGLESDNAARIAAEVERRCSGGLAVVPMLGGYCVVSRNPNDDPALTRFGPACRLVDEARLAGLLSLMDADSRAGVRRVLCGPAVGVLPANRVGLATEPLALELRRRLGEVWFGLAPEGLEPGELAEDMGRSAEVVVTARDPWQPGPTVVNFTHSPAVVDRRGKSAILDIERELGRPVRLGPGMAFSVLVVCTGNSCRSPMAAGILSKLVAGLPVFVYSAGTDAPVGASATRLALDVAREHGADISRHRAQQLSVSLVRAADLVLVMDRYHQARVIETLPEAASRTRLLLSFAGDGADEVEDPIGRSLEFYRRTAARMRAALEQVAADVRLRLG